MTDAHDPAPTPPRPAMVTLVMLTAASALTLNMFLPSLGSMAAAFGVGAGLASLAIGGYLAVTAGLQLVIGPLSDRYGRRPVLLACLAVYAAASAGCLLAPDFESFLAFRLLQGTMIVGSALSPAMIRDTHPAQEAASRIGYVLMAMAIGPMAGPMVGGLLDEIFGWRASFAVYTLIGAGLFAWCFSTLRETFPARAATFAQQFRNYRELLGNRNFWGCALCLAFSVGGFYAFLAGAPLVAGSVLALSPAELGLCLGTITGGFAFGSFLSGRIAKRFPLGVMMVLGRSVACAGLAAGLALVVAAPPTLLTVFGSTLCLGIGNGLSSPSASAGAVSAQPGLAGSAAGLSGALTVGMGAVLSTLSGALLTLHPRAEALLGLMLACALVSLAAALWVRRRERAEAAEDPRPAAA
ncbi:MAG: multidrug effflux MFS transporter [Pseudomonadota bacterium]|nr:multidrug effflux MFS transporter [Pseudomonadota bacterium]